MSPYALISCKRNSLHLHFFSSSWQVQDYYLQDGHEHSAPQPVQFTHCASCHSTAAYCARSTKIVVKQTASE